MSAPIQLLATTVTASTGPSMPSETSKATELLEQPVRVRHIRSLDGLRALSIALVFIAHLAGTKGVPFTENLTIDFIGNLGVRVFFVISGFLITTLLLKEQDKSGTINIRSFYTRRVLRIFPAFYCFFCAVALLTSLHVLSVPKASFVIAGTFLADFVTPVWEFGHIWSLSIEEQFYLFWPAAVLLISRKKLTYATVLFAVASPLLAVGLRLLHLSVAPTLMMNFGSLACGCALALVSQETLRRTVGVISLRLVPFVIVVALGLVFALIQGPQGMHMIGIGVVNLAIVAVLYRTMQVPDLLSRMLNSRVLVFFGVRSYSLYLWQQIFFNRAGSHEFNFFPFNLLLALLCGVLSYALIEQPFLRLKQRLENKSIRIAQSSVVVPSGATGHLAG